MTNTPDHVCHVCVKDPYLKAEIKAAKVKAACLHCGMTRPAMNAWALARRIDDTIQQLYVTSREDDGPDWAELVAEEAQIDPAIAEVMRQSLSHSRGYSARKDGEEDIWDSSAVYEESRLDRGPYLRRWEQFKESVKQEARFFNRHAETYLDDIFTGIEEQASWQGETVIRKWRPSTTRQLVRARVAQSDAEITTYLSNPSKEIGPPPKGTASAGRMNAAGVSAFYGAMDVATARAEVRPPVGSHAVFARFDILRPLRILDMDALARIAVKGSIFASDYSTRLGRAAFLRNFGNEIAQPVMPRDEVFGYLPTQVVADYIGQRLRLDGMLFRSVQSGRKKSDAGTYPQNIVLFNHASRVEDVDVSNRRVEVDLGWIDEEEDDADDSISVDSEELPKKREPKAKPRFQGIAFEDGPDPEDVDDRPVTLRFVPESVTVERIRGIDYDADERHISFRHRTLKEVRAQKRQYEKLMGKPPPFRGGDLDDDNIF